MLRQPFHSLILVFLLFVTTFSFVLRSVEFLTVREQIFRIGDYYQAIGFLSGDDFYEMNRDVDVIENFRHDVFSILDNELYDVKRGADFLENNRYVEFVDRRRGVKAIMQGMLNADIGTTHSAFFYGELIDIIELPEGGWRLILAVDDVLVGYPEHVVAHQEKLQMDFNLELQSILEMYYNFDEFVIDNMEIGERYFLRGSFSPSTSAALDDPPLSGSGIPIVGRKRNVLQMEPLTFEPNGLWFVHAPYGEMVDFTLSGLENVLEEAELLNYRYHGIQLRTTQDMALIPFMLEEAEMGFIVDGRPIDHEDHLSANPVAVIHQQFARTRDLNIGDTITVSIPQTHHAEVEIMMQYHISTIGLLDPFFEVGIESAAQDARAHEIELTIVGIYDLFKQIGGNHATNTIASIFVYVPDSVVQDDIVITSDIWGNPDGEHYLPSIWYSFMLESSRHEEAFLAEVSQPLEEMGLIVTMIDSGAENFWESANVILQSITFNGIVFSIVLILVLLLVTFLFLRQRRKEFAVSRVLGYSISRSVKGVMLAAALFFAPIAFGSVLAWLFAGRTIVNTLLIFEELHEGYEALFSLSPLWLIGLVAVIFVLTMLMVFIGALYLMRRPVLELLQRKE